MNDLAFDASGSGEQGVVLVHGFPFTSMIWRVQREALGTQARRVITPDLPGFGHTPGSADSVDAYAAGVCGVLDRLELERAVLGGISMGGYVALAFARLYPERLQGLILADTRAGAESDEGRAGR
ncbi:MAG: alpha/beta fold hydrolase, partial [Solirubrobacteraceae bacterium]